MTADLVKRLREAAEKATPGPWRVQEYSAVRGLTKIIESYDPVSNKFSRHLATVFANDEAFYEPEREAANAEFIAAANPAVILSLLDRIEALEAAASSGIQVGHGLTVYGSIEAIMRVQNYILLDSTHPQEKEDGRRSLAKALQKAEAALEAAASQPSREAELVKALTNIIDTYDRYRARGVLPAPAEYADVVKAINTARTLLAAYTPATPDAGREDAGKP